LRVRSNRWKITVKVQRVGRGASILQNPGLPALSASH
jgi:hypothetical protein